MEQAKQECLYKHYPVKLTMGVHFADNQEMEGGGETCQKRLFLFYILFRNILTFTT